MSQLSVQGFGDDVAEGVSAVDEAPSFLSLDRDRDVGGVVGRGPRTGVQVGDDDGG